MNWISFESECAREVLSGAPWKDRIEKMASMISGITSIADLGAGEGLLKSFIDDSIKYYPVDYCKRNDDTIVCDFNQYQFPDIDVEAFFISGCMEYIDDWRWFIEQVCLRKPNQIIMSYFTVKDKDRHKEREWEYNGLCCDYANALTENDLIEEYENNGYVLKKRDFDCVTGQPLFLFCPKEYEGNYEMV